MKIPFFISVIFSTILVSSGESSAAVRDTNGEFLRSGTGYYILPAIRGKGGGIALVPTTQRCPLDVVQENNEARNGLPLTFIPVNGNKDGIIRESTDLNIKFSDSIRLCGQPPVWRVEDVNGQRVVSSRGILGNPGPGTVNNLFKIEKYSNGYKLVFCPTVCKTCRPACGDIGSTIAKNGRRSLVLSQEPLVVMFKKA